MTILPHQNSVSSESATGLLVPDSPPEREPLKGCIVKYEDCFTPMYYYWSSKMHMNMYPSRKQWEDVVIVQALWERGCLAPGKSGLGFGVGKEKLASLFASYGCTILGTDQALSDQAKREWQDTNQLSTNMEEMFFPEIVDRDTFKKNVSFENCDMNDIPSSYLGKFDFTYSACSLDHLGTITHGMKFIENSLKCLKPGGWAVHTTEYNVGSNERTIEFGPTVFWRRKDIEALTKVLRAKGYHIEDTDFNRGAHPENYVVDHQPYKPNHTVLEVGGQTISSILIIAQRPISMADTPQNGIEFPFVGSDNGHVHTPFLKRLKRSIRKRLAD